MAHLVDGDSGGAERVTSVDADFQPKLGLVGERRRVGLLFSDRSDETRLDDKVEH
jgi:hypothetical protein